MAHRSPIGSGSTAGVLAFFILGVGLMGLTYGPQGRALAEMVPTAVRYTGASPTFNLGGIVGASLAPSIATWLASAYSLTFVGCSVTAATVLTVVALLAMGGAEE